MFISKKQILVALLMMASGLRAAVHGDLDDLCATEKSIAVKPAATETKAKSSGFRRACRWVGNKGWFALGAVAVWFMVTTESHPFEQTRTFKKADGSGLSVTEKYNAYARAPRKFFQGKVTRFFQPLFYTGKASEGLEKASSLAWERLPKSFKDRLPESVNKYFGKAASSDEPDGD